ncbi:MAG: hypothetical protein IKE23_04745, partial [Exiguobacterium sp.]|nr:hypothetical protein [Exiguobacterium sp.]
MIINEVVSRLKTILFSTARSEFDLKSLTPEALDDFITDCTYIYEGHPWWIDEDNGVTTVNFARSVCAEVARLTCMNAETTVDGSARAKWLQDQYEKCVADYIRNWVELGCANGTIILKPNGEGVDVFPYDRFMVTNQSNNKITGAVFIDQKYEPEAKEWFIRLEEHEKKNDKYIVRNTCFVSDSKDSLGDEIPIEDTPWNGMEEEVEIEGVDGMLFAVFRMPSANNLHFDSPLGLPIFADAIQEMEDLDVAYSRNTQEIFDSSRTVLLDSDRLIASGERARLMSRDERLKAFKLPRFVKAIEGTGQGDIYHEINPTLNTAIRLQGIENLLSQISFKCGFSNGYFTFNQKTGMVTATQVESDDRRTLQLITDVRTKLKQCLDDLFYALDKFADLYGFAPSGDYEVNYDFADLTLNEEEDRARWYQYVMAGQVPFWKFLVMYEGYNEDEAKEIQQLAQEERQQQMQL